MGAGLQRHFYKNDEIQKLRQLFVGINPEKLKQNIPLSHDLGEEMQQAHFNEKRPSSLNIVKTQMICF